MWICKIKIVLNSKKTLLTSKNISLKIRKIYGIHNMEYSPVWISA